MSILNGLKKTLRIGTFSVTIALLAILSTSAAYCQNSAKGGTIFASEVKTVAEGFKFTEGPVWHPDGYLLFSNIPANQIVKWTPGPGKGKISIFDANSGQSNGLALDKNKNLVTAEHGTRQVSLTRKDGTKKILADTFNGKKLNSPNDIAIHSTGSIFFTDPHYGLQGRKQEQPCRGVYRLDPDGKLVLLIEDIQTPNGVALSPDETRFYVADSQNGFINVYDIARDKSLSNSRRFCDVAGPDGIKTNTKGQLFTTSREGIVVFSPEGKRLATVAVPEKPTNCAFGGKNYKTLFITAGKGLYSVDVQTPGIAPKK